MCHCLVVALYFAAIYCDILQTVDLSDILKKLQKKLNRGHDLSKAAFNFSENGLQHRLLLEIFRLRPLKFFLTKHWLGTSNTL